MFYVGGLGASEVLVEGLIERDERQTEQGKLNVRVAELTQ